MPHPPPASRHYDLLVIGAGSGRMVLNEAVVSGRHTAIVDAGPYGGTCLNRGCIPSKMLVHAAEVAATVRDAARFGVDARVEGVRWADIRARVFGRIDPYAAAGPDGARAAGIDAFEGRARFVGDRRLLIEAPDGPSPASGGPEGGRSEGGGPGEPGGAMEVTADQIVLATGGHPDVPDVVRESGIGYETSDSIMRIDALPERLVVIGGGVVAIEMATVFGALGAQVSLVTRGPLLARKAGADIAARFTTLARERWAVHTDASVVEVVRAGDDIRLRLADGAVVAGDVLLVATGRRPNTAGIGLEVAGVDVDATTGRVVVDEYGRTTASGVWALGDVSTEIELKHLANHQARTVRHNLLHPAALTSLRTTAIPAAIFGDPQLAWVGQTLEEARAAGLDAVAASRELGDTAYGWALEDTTSVCTVVAERGTGVVLGAQVMAPFASSLIQPLVDAVTRGLTARHAASTPLWIHPAAMEVVENALLDAARLARG